MSEELATALSLIAFVAFIVIIIMGLTETEQGTFAERGKNPNLSTSSWEQHQKRLNKFRKSKYKSITFHVGSRGVVHYITSRGTKVYC